MLAKISRGRSNQELQGSPHLNEPFLGPSMYDPPYESPLEDEFAWRISKYLNRKTVLAKQIEVETICGAFRIDFVATTQSGIRVAYECDGEQFHEPRRDEWRDAMILGSGLVDSIIRLRGADLTYHPDDVLLLLARWDPELFSERSHFTLRRLASDCARAYEHDSRSVAMLTYPSECMSNPLHIFLQRRNRVVPRGRREFWQAAFKFANDRGAGNLDEVLNDWKARGSGAAVVIR